MWLLIPLFAGMVAVAWTGWLARRERQRADEDWRAKRLAALGPVLAATPVIDDVAGDHAHAGNQAPATRTGSEVSVSSVEVDLTDADANGSRAKVAQEDDAERDRVAGAEIRTDE